MGIYRSHEKYQQLISVSNPSKVIKNANSYLGKNNYQLFISEHKDKKYVIVTPEGKWVNFGNIKYEDFTKHNDQTRRNSYLSRATKIRGNWKYNKYSPNNLAIHLLWN